MSDASLSVQARVPDGLGPAIAERLDAAARAEVGPRLREGDATLWAPAGTPEVSDRLGWLTIAERERGELAGVLAFADEVRRDGVRDAVLLGMGGSSLAPEVLRRCFGAHEGFPRLHVLDSTDAAAVRAVSEQVDPAQVLFVVSSKSGGTIEPLSLFAHFWSLSGRGSSFVAITDPGTSLEELARAHGFRAVFSGDPAIGGRYSALSAFGIVPGALMGADVGALLDGAAAAWATAVDAPDSEVLAQGSGERVAGVWLGAALSALAGHGRDKLTFLIPDTLPGLGLWLEQLFAESTGKRGTGILPVAEEPVGAARDYGSDRVFAHLPDAEREDTELERHVHALAAAGHPVFTIPTQGPRDLGRLFLLFEIAVAAAGWGLGINPFDQPNVQQAKDATKRVLEEFEQTQRLQEEPDASDAALERLLGDAEPPAYVALMGYTRPSEEFDAAIAQLRDAIRARGLAATTFGYGPRFLHSTGQLHKGGPRTGRFLQLIHDGPEDVPIPGAGYSFTTLKHAQASGDLETLRELGLPAERVRLAGDDPVGAVRALATRLK